MTTAQGLRVRRSIQQLQDDYKRGNKKPLEDLMRAWKGIKELPSDNPHSFFMIGGFHGEPFRGAGWSSASYWGGFCNHGNILFPTWHRAYLMRLEDALRSIAGCADVTLPFWDETSEDSIKYGVPWALTQDTVTLDGKSIPNPLRSFAFTKGITDHIDGDEPNYTKPRGYETVRYPLSGLVGSDADRAATKAHNAKYPNYEQNVALLNQNVVNWLGSQVVVNGQTIPTNVAEKYRRCLDAPNYTVFSNTSSASQWNDDRPGQEAVAALESPHNSIHLAVGGFDVPGVGDDSPIEGANGDMGENDTAGLDPIFYFHHCFIDRVFWLWQKRHGFTDHLEVIAEYPGTNSVDGQGATPGTQPNSWLTLASPLDPFKKADNGRERPYTSLDCVNIERQLGYTYGPGSLEEPDGAQLRAASPSRPGKVIRVSGINRAPIRGSFLVSVFATIDGKRYHIGTEAILSRWAVKYCANCQTHLEVRAHVGTRGIPDDALAGAVFDAEVRTRDGKLTPVAFRSLTNSTRRPFRIDVLG